MRESEREANINKKKKDEKTRVFQSKETQMTKIYPGV